MFRRITIVLALIGIWGCRTGSSRLDAQRPALDSAVVPLPTHPMGELRWPSATWYESGWVVAANLFPKGANARVASRALYLAHSRTGLLSIPEGDFLFGYPLVLTTPSGALSLFWVEGTRASTPPGWLYRLASLWHASYEDGKWTKPERLVNGSWLAWESRAVQAIADEHGRLHVIVPAADSGRQEELLHLVRDSAGWHRRRLPVYGIYPAIAALSAGRLAMTFVMDDGNGRSSGLYSLLSRDNGATWSVPRRVLPASDTAAVYKPQLRVVGDSLYLAWTTTRNGDGGVWSFAARRADGTDPSGEWPGPVHSELIPGPLLNVTFAVTGCGEIRAVAEALTPRMESVVRELRLRGDRVTIDNPFGDSFAIAPVTERSRDRIVQVWSTMRTGSDSVQPFLRELSTCR